MNTNIDIGFKKKCARFTGLLIDVCHVGSIIICISAHAPCNPCEWWDIYTYNDIICAENRTSVEGHAHWKRGGFVDVFW